jgi:hypothetical protein
MKIIDVLCVPGRSGFFTDDAAAIAAGALHDGFPYAAEPNRTLPASAQRHYSDAARVIRVGGDSDPKPQTSWTKRVSKQRVHVGAPPFGDSAIATITGTPSASANRPAYSRFAVSSRPPVSSIALTQRQAAPHRHQSASTAAPSQRPQIARDVGRPLQTLAVRRPAVAGPKQTPADKTVVHGVEKAAASVGLTPRSVLLSVTVLSEPPHGADERVLGAERPGTIVLAGPPRAGPKPEFQTRSARASWRPPEGG